MIEEIEKLRKNVLYKTIACFVVIITIIILTIGFTNIPALIVFELVIGMLITGLITKKDQKAFSDLYKKEIVIAAFNKVCTDIQFNLDNGIPYQTIAATEMMYMGDRYFSNDYITGKYKSINFEMSDVEIQEEHTDSDGDSSYVTIFKGQWYIFDFNKTFKANIQVCEKSFRNSRRKSLFVKKEEKYKKVELEDIDFNKVFKVYAQNELDAFYVLTPNTMEKIKSVNNKIRGDLLFCFIDNRLHIGLYNNRDLFEASIFKKVDINKATQKTLGEISIITNFVDILSLDNDLFKTQGGGVIQ